MVSDFCIAVCIVSRIGFVGFEHKQKLDFRLGLDPLSVVGLMCVLFAGSFG